MSLLMFWQELGFWMGLAMWAATQCFSIVNIYAPDDVVIGMVWAHDADFVNYVADYDGRNEKE